MQTSKFFYGALVNARLSMDSFDLGHGVTIRKTYAHLFTTNMMAFSPAKSGKPHSGPWKVADAGIAHDLEVEISAPDKGPKGTDFDAKDTIWWIASLIRIMKNPSVSVRVLADMSFSEAASPNSVPHYKEFESALRNFEPAGVRGERADLLEEDDLEAVKQMWVPSAKLISSNPKLAAAFRAFDYAGTQGRTSSSMLALWGALESIFVPQNQGEITFRISSYIAAFLSPPDVRRHQIFRDVKKLYSKRSTAAHSSGDIDQEPLISSWVLMRNILVRILRDNEVPSQARLEEFLFGISHPPNLWED